MYSVFQATPRLELIPSLVIKPRIFIMLALGDDDDMMTAGFCFWLGVRQREDLDINRRSTQHTCCFHNADDSE